MFSSIPGECTRGDQSRWSCEYTYIHTYIHTYTSLYRCSILDKIVMYTLTLNEWSTRVCVCVCVCVCMCMCARKGHGGESVRQAVSGQPSGVTAWRGGGGGEESVQSTKRVCLLLSLGHASPPPPPPPRMHVLRSLPSRPVMCSTLPLSPHVPLQRLLQVLVTLPRLPFGCIIKTQSLVHLSERQAVLSSSTGASFTCLVPPWQGLCVALTLQHN